MLQSLNSCRLVFLVVLLVKYQWLVRMAV